MTELVKLEAWEEKYRPTTFGEFIDEGSTFKDGKFIGGKVEKINRILNGGIFKHFMFYGDAGTGKTTLSYILAKEWLKRISKSNNTIFDSESIKVLNASDDRGIEVVRKRIKKIVTSTGAYVIILDEADAMTSDAQTAMRRLMEQAKKTKSPKLFILTCNYPGKIIEPIHSRCEVIEFKPISLDKMTTRLQYIIQQENVTEFIFNDVAMDNTEKQQELESFFEYIYHFSKGDMRKAISTVQEFVYTNEDTKKRVLDLTLRDKIESMARTKVEVIMEQIFDNKDPTFENIFQFVQDVKSGSPFVSKIFLDLMMWIRDHSRVRGGLGQVMAKHMAVAVGKYESRVRNKSDLDVQLVTMFSELSLIFMTGHIIEND